MVEDLRGKSPTERSLVAIRTGDPGSDLPCHSVIFAATGIDSHNGIRSRLLRSEDRGISWSELTLEPAADQSLETLSTIQAPSSGRVLVGTNGWRGGRLYRSPASGWGSVCHRAP